MLISVRGRAIACNAKSATQAIAYMRMYENYSDEKLDKLDQETRELYGWNKVKGRHK